MNTDYETLPRQGLAKMRSRRRPRLGKNIDLTGNRLGRLKVLEPWSRDPRRGVYWLCKCDCENYAIVRGANLLASKTFSCGCKQIEMAEQIIRKAQARQQEVWRLIEGR